MTGHGRGAARGAQGEVVVEITAVNKKALEVGVTLPRDFSGAESFVQEQVKAAVARGALRVSVEVRGAVAERPWAWNEAAVAASLARLRAFAEQHGVVFSATPDLIFQLACKHQEAAPETALAEVLPLIESALAQALVELQQMRAREGAALAADLGARLAQLRAGLAQMLPELAGVAARQKELLLQRLRQAGLALDPADERVLREIALFADRADVSEEVTRLQSHFEQFEGFLRAREPIGRKIEFLLQEIGREFNTLGAKSPSVAVTRLVMEAKNELERVREQAANVE